MPPSKKQITGRLGEKEASQFLQKKGYKILETNLKKRYLEIDIVAKKDDIIVFIEVKTRSIDNIGTAEEAVDRKKIRRLIRSAKLYQNFHSNYENTLRIDAVCVYFDNNFQVKLINHYENISQL